MIFSIMLWAPSWGGMLNGLLTLRGGWAQLRTDPVLKFFAAALTFYGMATFEGPLLSIKSVSALAHYTDWIIGHVHGGALGWNGFMAAGMFYWMVPRLYGRELYSRKLADFHFYIGTFGILLYMVAMWVSGITQGLMWKATNPDGSLLYPNFVETLLAIVPLYWLRLLGGSMYLMGFLLMGYNLWKTAQAGQPVDGSIQVYLDSNHDEQVHWSRIVFGRPVILVSLVMALVGSLAVVNDMASVFLSTTAVFVAVVGTMVLQLSADPKGPSWHRLLEGRGLLFTVFTTVAVLIGGVAELVPALLVTPSTTAQTPYRPLELEGRDIYVREGCYVCHSQMIRPFPSEAQRYGDISKMDDSQFDHPFQWGSKRTGPDLARVGGKYPHSWHYRHMIDPRAISPGSNMPAYAFLTDTRIDFERTTEKVRAMRSVGVPYTAQQVQTAQDDAHRQALEVQESLKQAGIGVSEDSELVALISYLQRLGKVQVTQDVAPAVARANH
jgi:cytochrome c oxidase cbb3-type subunit I/II